MNVKNTIPCIQSSSSDGAGASVQDKEQTLQAYVNLANRICTRIAQEKHNDVSFDSMTVSGVP